MFFMLSELLEGICEEDFTDRLGHLGFEDICFLTPELRDVPADRLILLSGKTEEMGTKEFQDLISYQEVRDLIALVVTRGAEFAENEPDLVREILRTLGVGEDVLAALSFLAANSGEIKAIAGDFLTGENGEALRTYLEGFFGSEDMALLLDAISAAASGQQNAAPDSEAESAAERA